MFSNCLFKAFCVIYLSMCVRVPLLIECNKDIHYMYMSCRDVLTVWGYAALRPASRPTALTPSPAHGPCCAAFRGRRGGDSGLLQVGLRVGERGQPLPLYRRALRGE